MAMMKEFKDFAVKGNVVDMAIGIMLVKGINSAKRKEEAKPAAPPKPSAEETLLGEIRDLLKQRG